MAQEKVSSEHSMTSVEAAENIKRIAQNVRDSSIKFRDIVRSMRETGALKEISEAARDAVIASRDAARDISETAKELRESGVIDETAAAIHETSDIARNTAKDFGEKAKQLKQNMTSEDRPGTTDTKHWEVGINEYGEQESLQTGSGVEWCYPRTVRGEDGKNLASPIPI